MPFLKRRDRPPRGRNESGRWKRRHDEYPNAADYLPACDAVRDEATPCGAYWPQTNGNPTFVRVRQMQRITKYPYK
jgi:hypothetical protein